ncbi:OLC1v1000465C1 [Oldenlandia corymbosa var. corymbosa]|uniref:OLC1v1000465C1 n=1 Tax=Oldenlandia corymbosa var. corymbosa TaxID=529605 RepID=A0AAV1D3X8_OLDCO|nr:OLC1v1000465C1 [Oldenlandia corymbosa var. corymbosa]
MECSSFYNLNSVANSSFFQRSAQNNNCQNAPSRCSFPCSLPALKLKFPSSSFVLHCCDQNDESLSTSAAYDVLGIAPNCTPAQLKAAFRAKVKEFHPDVRQDEGNSDIMIRRVIRAYEMLSDYSRSEIIERECSDPFDEPECEAFDIFVNEAMCIGKACPYSCVKRAPQAFEFSSLTGTARATSQGSSSTTMILPLFPSA